MTGLSRWYKLVTTSLSELAVGDGSTGLGIDHLEEYEGIQIVQQARAGGTSDSVLAGEHPVRTYLRGPESISDGRSPTSAELLEVGETDPLESRQEHLDAAVDLAAFCDCQEVAEVRRRSIERLRPKALDQVELGRRVCVACREDRQAVASRALPLDPAASEHRDWEREQRHVARVQSRPCEEVVVHLDHRSHLPLGLSMDLDALATGSAGRVQLQPLAERQRRCETLTERRMTFLIDDERLLVDHRKRTE